MLDEQVTKNELATVSQAVCGCEARALHSMVCETCDVVAGCS